MQVPNEDADWSARQDRGGLDAGDGGGGGVTDLHPTRSQKATTRANSNDSHCWNWKCTWGITQIGND